MQIGCVSWVCELAVGNFLLVGDNRALEPVPICRIPYLFALQILFFYYQVRKCMYDFLTQSREYGMLVANLGYIYFLP